MRQGPPTLFYVVLAFALTLRIWLLFESHVLYWDAAVYIGMAKYIYSWGQLGLWEPIRPIVWPLLLGLPWKAGLDPAFWGNVMQTLFAGGIIWLVYEIGEIVGGRKAGVIASSIMAFSTVFIFLNYRLLSELPAAFFVCLAVYLYLKEQPFYAGLAASLAFLTKFPFGLVLVAVILADIPRYKVWLKYLGGFAIPAAGYLLLNTWWYGNAFYPLTEAARVIKLNVACNITFAQPWHMYLSRIPFDNFFMIFAIFGIIFAVGAWEMKDRIILLSLVLPMAYLFQLSCRDFRFAMVFLPFLAILAGYGISSSLKESFFRWPQLYPMLVIAIIGFSSIIGTMNYYAEEPSPWPEEMVDYYYSYANGTIIAASPWPAAYQDIRVRTLYYPNFDTLTARSYRDYFVSGEADYVFMDECAGGIECGPSDVFCPLARENMLGALDSYQLVVSFSRNQCLYGLYANPDLSKDI